MERIPLHSWEMEFSIQYHVTINSQLNDQKVLYNILWTIDNLHVRLIFDQGKKKVNSCKELIRISKTATLGSEML
jgi:hypothetical protein